MNDSITRFDKDMDGSMEPSDHGRWVRYDDHTKRIAELEQALSDAGDRINTLAANERRLIDETIALRAAIEKATKP